MNLRKSMLNKCADKCAKKGASMYAPKTSGTCPNCGAVFRAISCAPYVAAT